MATTPTNLPVPSETPRDLKFNAGKIDEFVTSLVNTYIDRFGNEHYTIEGLRWLAQQAISEYGWVLIDSFQDGADITLPNQALRDEDTGEYYRWDGALPKHIDAGSTPSSSGGVGVGAWIGIGDASLRAMLATSSGASIIGAKNQDGTASNVQDVLNSHGQRISVREQQIDRTGHVSDLSREGTAAKFSQRYRVPHRLVNKTVPQDATKKYDHFGIMDTKPDGTIYQMFRRASTHTDEGRTVYIEMQKNGVWSQPITVASESGVDCRGASGGTAPDGAIYCAGAKMVPNPDPANISNVFLSAFIYKSEDYGKSWRQVANIPSSVNGTIPYGKLQAIGDKLVIPYYKKDSSNYNNLALLTSNDNGETWFEGAIISSGVDYNEAAVLNCGDGVVICVSRMGSGTVAADGTNRFRQFLSGDGGLTWTDQGYVIGPDAAEEIGWQIVSPSLELCYSSGGTPYVVLSYTCRVGSVRYRTAQLYDITSGLSNRWSIFKPILSLTGTKESGYQSTFISDNVIYGNIYRTTVEHQISISTQFQVPLGDLPDYDSGWFAVTALTNDSKNHGLLTVPSRTVIQFSPDSIGKTGVYPTDNTLYYDGTTTVGAGIAWQVNQSGYTIRPGKFMYYQGVFGTGGLNPTSGYIRILAWK